MKKLLALFLAILCTLGCVSALAATAADGREIVTVTMMMQENAGQPVRLECALLDYLKDRFGLDIQLQPIPASDWSSKVATVLATDDMPDILVNIPYKTLAQYAPENMFVDLTANADKLPTYSSIIWGEDRALETKKFTVGGSVYGFRKLEYYRIALMPAPCIRADLMQELNLKTPTSFDELYQVMLEIKKAHPEVYFFSSRSGTNYMLGQMAFAFGTGGFAPFMNDRGMYFEPDYDKYVYGPTDARFAQLVAFVAKAYADGLVDPDYATNKKAELWEKITSGKIAFFYDNNSFLARAFNPAFDAAGNGWRMELLAPLANNITTTRAFRYERDWDFHTVISSQTKYADRILEMFDWLYSDEGVIYGNFGPLGVTCHIDEATGNPIVEDAIVRQVEGASDYIAATKSILGTGAWSWTPYIHDGLELQLGDGYYVEMAEKIVQPYTDNGTVTFLRNPPNFTEEEMEEVIDIELELANIFNQEINAFIMGKKDISQWDAVVAKLRDAGAARLEEIFNAANDRLR